MTKTEAIKIYDGACKAIIEGDPEAANYATIAKYLAKVNDAERSDYVRRSPSTEKALRHYLTI